MGLQDAMNRHPSDDQPLHSVSQEPDEPALVRARPVRYDLNVGADIVGVVSVVDEGAGERWLLEIDAFQSQQVSVKFTTEHEALQMAEEWMKAQRQVQRLAATMERSGEGFSVR